MILGVQNILNLYKKVGETPLECLDRFRHEYPEYEGIPMTYAGRLDPMAEGVLIALVGEEAKNRDQYTNLDKEYEFEVLFGFETDTYDILGLVKNVLNDEPTHPTPRLRRASKDKIISLLAKFKGTISQPYPPYSSKTVSGIPLFEWARKGKLDEIEIPKRDVEVYNLELTDSKTISKDELEKNIIERIGLVKGDFRQVEILAKWEEALKDAPDNFEIFKFKISCGSGTYVRVIAHELGNVVGCGAIAWSIKRTKVGDFS
ncbi:MAG: hypothetical protein WC795_00285 [Candidatus Paceibacterota bacterium]